IGAHLKFPGPPGTGSGVLSRLTFKVKAPYGQTGFNVDPNSQLNLIEGPEIPSEKKEGKAEAVIDPTGKVGCWTVNSTEDGADIAPGDGIADASSEPGKVKTTLRAALQEANAFNQAQNQSGDHRISFRIPGASTIMPLSALPSLADAKGGIILDGSTKEGVV